MIANRDWISIVIYIDREHHATNPNSFWLTSIHNAILCLNKIISDGSLKNKTKAFHLELGWNPSRLLLFIIT